MIAELRQVSIYTPNNGHNGTDWQTYTLLDNAITHDDDFKIIEGNKIEKIEVISDRHVKITCKYETLDFYGMMFSTMSDYEYQDEDY